MLREFLKNRRSELITRWALQVAKRSASEARLTDEELGIPFFLDQLLSALQVGHSATVFDGRDFLRRGFTVSQVVHGCGGLGEAITELVSEHHAVIELEEFRTLDRCLDNAIAAAVAEYAFPCQSAVADHIVLPPEERLEVLSLELRNRIHAATLALTAIRLGHVGRNGATGLALDKALSSLSRLIDHSLADVRGTARLAPAMP